MTIPNLTHHIGGRTDFSLAQSIIKPKSLVQEVAGYDYQAITVTDMNTVNSMPKIYGVTDDLKVNFGAVVKVVDDLGWRKPKKNEKRTKNAFFCPRLIAKDQQGVFDIMNLLSLANSEDHFYMTPQVDLQDLIDTASKGNVIVTTGDVFSLFSLSHFHSKLAALVRALNRSDLLCEIVPVETLYFDRINELALKTAQKIQLKSIVSRPAFYIESQGNVRNAIGCSIERNTIDSQWRNEPDVENLHVMNPEDTGKQLAALVDRMKKRGIDADRANDLIRDAVENTNKLGSELNFKFEKLPISLPNLSDRPFESLVAIVKQGWKERITKSVYGYKPENGQLPEYQERLKYELGVLRSMGFESYFLLVHQVVSESKRMGIRVGPGRGSVGGSLIAFLMGITDVDPIRFGLIFERFINPDRLDLPDADLDFMSSRRQEVIDWLVDTYGQEYVCGISNYGELGPSSALRRIGSVYNLSDKDYDCSKMVPKEHGESVSLEKAAEEVGAISLFAKQFPDVWDVACKAQGVFNIYGQHAAGVVVAGDEIASRAVVEKRANGIVCNWDKKFVEDFGLVKLDILGLSNLDVLQLALNYIKERHGVEVDYEDVPLNDPEVLKQFGDGNTNAVFQFESGGMKGLLKDLAKYEALTFEDITAATALYRPGPLDAGLTEQYIEIKQGDREVEYPHELCEPALKETHGVMVYQEQVMQIARDLCGFSMTEADTLRKAIGKKDAELMQSMGDQFISGAVSNGMCENDARSLWDDVVGFAAYSFNKSHAVAYTLISYLTMWLKTRYPAEFFASAMSILKEEKLPGLVRDAESKGISIMPPDINRSSDRFEIIFDGDTGNDSLYIPFQRVKGLSDKSCTSIMEARQKRLDEKGDQTFPSKTDFLSYVDKRRCNIRVQNALDEVGAFAEIEGQVAAKHPDRVKSQKQLLPGLIATDVKADRVVEMSPYVRQELKNIIEEAKELCPDYASEPFVLPAAPAKRNPKFMVVTDAPNWTEKNEGIMTAGKASQTVNSALKEAGLKPSVAYFTALSKKGKPDNHKEVPLDMFSDFAPILDKEIELLKPPVIVALGSKAARHLVPDLKGGWAEIAGTTHYDAKRDCTIVVGCNPSMVYFDPDRINLIVDAFNTAREIIE